MSRSTLTDTSYAVLGLIDQLGPSTPYRLKGVASVSVFHFWTMPHTQIYSECRRLAESGLLDEQREETGRRRRTYRLTRKGREALAGWRADPNTDFYELRDPGLLKLFAGADPQALADTQVAAHERRLHSYEVIRGSMPDMPEGMRLALEAGIGHAREYVRFWSDVGKRTRKR
jgi:PadR family transcriptional regulator, regulatory protein AphA